MGGSFSRIVKKNIVCLSNPVSSSCPEKVLKIITIGCGKDHFTMEIIAQSQIRKDGTAKRSQTCEEISVTYWLVPNEIFK